MPKMNEKEYAEYCRYWQRYLQSSEAWRFGLSRSLKKFNPRIGNVLKWPKNWPEVEVWFGGIGNFVSAVQDLEKEDRNAY